MISLRNICKRYHYRGRPIDVLTDINLNIDAGEALCIRAPSGKGKTTLLNIMGGMLTPTSGTVIVNDQDITNLPLHFRSSFRRDNIGFIFQQFNLLPRFTVMENLLFPLIPKGANLSNEALKIEAILERLKIGHRKHFTVNLLSGGEQQRVSVARALVNNPKVFIADEPFTNLDPHNKQFIIDIFSELKAGGKTFIFSSTSDKENMGKGLIDRDMNL